MVHVIFSDCKDDTDCITITGSVCDLEEGVCACGDESYLKSGDSDTCVGKSLSIQCVGKTLPLFRDVSINRYIAGNL